MKIAYLILAHKSPHQLMRLITRLDNGNTSFIVHVDRKTSKKHYQEMVDLLGSKANIYFCKRHKVYWSDFSQVSATINGLQELFHRRIEFNYVKFLTGQDYPIKSINYIEKKLIKSNNNSFIEFFLMPSKIWQEGGETNGGLDRIKIFHFRIFNRQFKLPLNRNFPNGFKPFGGSAYWCLSRECAEYVNNFVKMNASFVNFFKNVKFADEIFFQTIIMNSPFKDSVINSNLTYTEWVWNAPNPGILTNKDFSKLSESSCLFARKFDVTQDSEILDAIDKNLLEGNK